MSSEKTFSQLGLPDILLAQLNKLGYENPTPVQDQSIPLLISGKDLVAQAQTGTGKTAAFALPIVAKIDLALKAPQAIVITPTRELAIQVAEAFQTYASALEDFYVTAIYGGQDYSIQLRALKRGSHVIVGTPGRLMDHLRRGTLKLSNLTSLVLDEADEMLNMGFIDDIEWILEQIPETRQTALFSATMPSAIQKIAKRYLQDPAKVHIKSGGHTTKSIEQCYVSVSKKQKVEALTRFLEVEKTDTVIIFTRTKVSAAELAEKLATRGYMAVALHGDIKQSQRKQVIDRAKSGKLDIIVATDVAARGIDIESVSHVINFDIPHDTESYTHRIGRTGRAGRTGKAILFITPREHRFLRDIEKTTAQSVVEIFPPSSAEMSNLRNKELSEKITRITETSKHLAPYKEMVEKLIEESGLSAADVATALAYIAQQNNPIPHYDLESPAPENGPSKGKSNKRSRRPFDRASRGRSGKPSFGDKKPKRRRDDDDKRPFGDKKAKRKHDGDKPAYGDKKPKRKYDGDKPAYGDKKPKRKYDGDKPAYGDKKPKRKHDGDKPAYGDKKPKRKHDGDKPSFDDKKPKRKGGPFGKGPSKGKKPFSAGKKKPPTKK